MGRSNLRNTVFYIENSSFVLGEENMKGIIRIDGNKNEIISNSNLIKLVDSDFSMYDNIFLCNNYNSSTKKSTKSNLLKDNLYYGSG